MQARWGTHGDHPIIALAPSSVRETFDLTVQAFNFSERYRTPVILLMDEIIGHMREGVELPDFETIERVERPETTVPPEWYKPYDNYPLDVPPLMPFGEGYRYHVTGLIHDQRGFPTSRPEEVKAFMKRLFRKITQNFFDIQIVHKELHEDADLLVIAYGSVARSARRAVREARKKGIKAGLLKIITLWPFPRRTIEPLLRKVRGVLVPELNAGQISREIKRINQGKTRVETLNRIAGKLMTPDEILIRLGRM